MQSENISVMAVFEAVAELGEVSRARISDMTGFSQVTVGKAVELLDSCKIITQNKVASHTVGRKSGICSLVKSNGMLILDLTGKTRVGLYDIALSLRDEYSCENIGNTTAQGLTGFSEILGGELMGIGCVIPSSKQGKDAADDISDEVGIQPELIVRADRAYAFANARRFKYDGMGIFIRLWKDGAADGALMYGNRLFTGSHGCAGNFTQLFSSCKQLSQNLCSLCLALDPSFIHISCEAYEDCLQIKSQVISDLRVLGEDGMPTVLVEPMKVCRSAMDGVAYMLREKYILSKLPYNT